jgi:hypothetical protein
MNSKAREVGAVPVFGCPSTPMVLSVLMSALVVAWPDTAMPFVPNVRRSASARCEWAACIAKFCANERAATLPHVKRLLIRACAHPEPCTCALPISCGRPVLDKVFQREREL